MFDIQKVTAIFDIVRTVVKQITTQEENATSILNELQEEGQEIKESIQAMIEEGHDVADSLTHIYLLISGALADATTDGTRDIAPADVKDVQTLKQLTSFIRSKAEQA